MTGGMDRDTHHFSQLVSKSVSLFCDSFYWVKRAVTLE